MTVPSKFKDRLPKKGVYLLIVNPERYSGLLPELIRHFGPEKKIAYVSLSRPKNKVLSALIAARVDISNLSLIAQPQNSPGIPSLTKLSIDISELANRGGFYALILDSLDTLLLYNDPATTQRFMQYILNKLSLLDLSGVVILLEGGESIKLLPLLSQYCNQIVRV